MDPLDVATGWVDITPYHNGWGPEKARPYWLAGYGIGDGADASAVRADAVHDNPLFAKCLVLAQGQRCCVLVTADILAFTRSMDQAIRPQVLDLGVADADFAMVGSHTHRGPVLDERLDPFISYWLDADLSEVHAYTSWLNNTIVSLVRNTLQAPRVSCRLDYGVGQADFAYNRYNGFSGNPHQLDMSAYLDHSVPVITARAVDGGKVRAIVFSYACHPVSFGGEQKDGKQYFDADYPGAAQKILEKTYSDGVVTFFLPGACGDNDPAGDRCATLSLWLGGTLARVVQDVVEKDDKTPLGGPVRTAITHIDLPLAISPSAQVKYFNRRASGDATRIGRHARRMLDTTNPSAVAKSVPLPVQMWTFADDAALQLALSGGEVVSSYSYHFKTKLGWRNRFWLSGYANQVPCYIPSDGMLANCGYEPGWHPDQGSDVAWSAGSTMYYGWPCRLATGTERLLIDTIHDMALKQRNLGGR